MLKSLELFGFKSFADRTRFDFSRGITGVVGPNGSGKSNVVDAIKWILGDQSAKSLRGKEMVDVIFNGAAGRKPSAFAEATLTFDNSTGFLPIESQEVHIGRRIWRSGDAEYLINHTTARLKDVRNLFLGTGAGGSAYCIIEQGRVDQILQANASTRRQVFEEAAGISRYTSRKADALRKLERVDQNLLRLTDIVDEVEARLNALRSQAVKAAKYREISTELRELWLGLAADDYRHCSREVAQVDEALQRLAAQLKAVTDRQQEIESRLAALDGELSEVDDHLREIERRRAANRETIAGHEATIRHQTARRRELDAEIVRLRKQRAMMAARSREVIDELAHHQHVLEQFETEYARRKEDLQSRETQIGDVATEIAGRRASVEQDRQRLLERMRAISALESRVQSLQSQLDASAAAGQAVQERREKLDEEVAAGRAECDRRKLSVDEALAEVAAAETRLQALQERRHSLSAEQDQSSRTLLQHREQRSNWQARKTVLEDLELRQEGLGIGVKEILSRAETSDYPPWNGILGSVADLIEVDLEHAALLEVALGGRAQLIVLEDYGPLIEYLNSQACQIAGRVGFLALSASANGGDNPSVQTVSNPLSPWERGRDEGNSATGEIRDLSGQPGVLNRADRVVRSSEKAPHLAEHLLADTWIVETLDAALQLSSGIGRGCRFVTLQGELLSEDGRLYVGTIGSDSAVVSRKSELRRLKNDIARLDRKVADEERRLAKVDTSLATADGAVDAAKAELQSLLDSANLLKAELAAHEQELSRRRRDRDAADEEAARIAAQQEQFRGELEQAQMDLARAEEELSGLQTGIDAAERDIARLEHRLQTLKERRGSEQLDLAKREERLHGLRDSFQRLEEEQEQRLQQCDEAERRFEAADSKRRQIVLHILNTGAVLAELFLKEEETAANAAQWSKEKDRLRGQRAKLLEEEAAIRQQRRDLDQAQHREEIKLRDLRHQITTLEERIEEEYQLVLTDVVDSGASAFQLYLAERQRRATARHDRDSDATSDEDSGVASTDSADETHPVAEFARIRADEDRDVARILANSATNELTANESEVENRHAESGSAQATDPTITFQDVRGEIEARVNRLRRKLKLMGNVNTDSLHDLDELEQRFGQLSSQLEDLTEAKTALEEIVRKINAESKRLFAETFTAIRGHFQDLFRKLFGGGEGDVILEDPEDILECGIDVVARPPGKELRSISLLSGGEKTMTAVALLLAIFKSRPSPFCILDEVDAALDEANVDRFVGVLKEFQATTQFIMITHRKPSMTVADLLYGVTMEQSGVSKRMSVRFEEVGENGEFTSRAA